MNVFFALKGSKLFIIITILLGTVGSKVILSKMGCRPLLTASVSVNSGRTETKKQTQFTERLQSYLKTVFA